MEPIIFRTNYHLPRIKEKAALLSFTYLCGKSTTTPPEKPARIADPSISSRCAKFSGYTCKTALAPLAKHLYNDPKKALK